MFKLQLTRFKSFISSLRSIIRAIIYTINMPIRVPYTKAFVTSNLPKTVRKLIILGGI